jgi:hypothetical protein
MSILREQAALLGPKTQNMIEAKVHTSVEYGDFYHTFMLVVPALDNYTYQLFRLRHGIELYPLVQVPEAKSMKNQEEFERWLREKLTSEETRRIISRLLAQATDS